MAAGKKLAWEINSKLPVEGSAKSSCGLAGSLSSCFCNLGSEGRLCMDSLAQGGRLVFLLTVSLTSLDGLLSIWRPDP